MQRGESMVIVLVMMASGCFPSFDGLSNGRESHDAASTDAASTDAAPFARESSTLDAELVTEGDGADDGAEADACGALACNGLVGTYYASDNFIGKNEIRTDAQIDFDWGYNAPLAGFVNDHFSVRWTGHLTPRFSEEYTFYVTSDDGAVLYIDDVKVIDHWAPHKATEDMGRVQLSAARHDIKLEYFDGGNEALISLAWSSTSQPKEIVPTSQLSP